MNSDDLIFVDSADEARLPRGQRLPKRRPKKQRPRPEVRGVRRRSRSLDRQQPYPRIQSRNWITPKNIIEMLESPSRDVIREGIKQLSMYVDPIRVQDISGKEWQHIMDLLSRHAQWNPSPPQSLQNLARQTMSRLRQARHDAGLPVFRQNPDHNTHLSREQLGWTFRDGTVVPFDQQIPSPRRSHSKKPKRRLY